MTRVRGVALGAAAVSGAALLVAWFVERRLGIVPCALCLVERWPYRVAIGLGVVAAVVPGWVSGVVRWLLVGCFVVGVGVGMVHVGVERGFWPSPLPECAAPVFSGGSIAERLAQMPSRPAKPCDAATYLVPGLPLSMAAMNVLLSLALAVCVAMSGAWRRRA